MTKEAWARGVIPSTDPAEVRDFYRTDPRATRGLIRQETFINKHVWDPCCGDGAIARVLRGEGFKVIATDLYDRGYGRGGVDFLRSKKPRSSNIIMNPPFTQAREFVDKALELKVINTYVFARLAFLEGIERKSWFETTPLTRVIILSKRPSMWKGNQDVPFTGLFTFAWLYWYLNYNGSPTLSWMNVADHEPGWEL